MGEFNQRVEVSGSLLFFVDGSNCRCAWTKSSSKPTAISINERDLEKLPIKNRGLASAGKGPREQASLLARPESALCTRTGRGRKEIAQRQGLSGSSCGPVPSIDFWKLSHISPDLLSTQGKNSEARKPQKMWEINRNIFVRMDHLI